MSQRITFDQLLKMMRDPDVPQSEIAKYIKVIPNAQSPFSPTVLTDPYKVDAAPLAQAAQVTKWVIEASVERRQELYRRKISNGWDGVRLVSEGDSWFQYPSFLWRDGSDVIDFLLDKYAIYCSAFAGDTLRNMKTELTSLQASIERENAKGLLFSAGGNDLAGRDETDQHGVGLGRFLLGRTGSNSDHGASGFISRRYDGFLNDVADSYSEIFSTLLGRFPDLKIFCHGYDRAHVFWRGSWLYPALSDRQKDIPEELWNPIVAELIDRFNSKLEELSGNFNGSVVHVDCRGAIGAKDEWRDELHGKKDGCERAAARFSTAIDKVLMQAIA